MVGLRKATALDSPRPQGPICSIQAGNVMALQRVRIAHSLHCAPVLAAAELPLWQRQLRFCIALPPGCMHLL